MISTDVKITDEHKLENLSLFQMIYGADKIKLMTEDIGFIRSSDGSQFDKIINLNKKYPS